MFRKVLIANRAAIACRIGRTLSNMGVGSVGVYTRADASSHHVSRLDEAVCLGEALASETYLDIDKVIGAALETGAGAIHPGYGFLSENVAFAEACEKNGIAFIGPTPEQISNFGLKHTARDIARQQQVPLLPGTELLVDLEEALEAAEEIGYPVMLKSTAGGGGIGMQLCWNAEDLSRAFESVKRLGRSNFSNDGVFLEKYIEHARHIEVQIFGDGEGFVTALGERDCSTQRRNQKVLEESPAPNISDEVRQAMMTTAVRLGEAVNYRSAGTVEFIFDAASEAFYFLEVNTRLQVEHGVTEEVTGVDLVEWMVRLAAGETDFVRAYRHAPKGYAIQARIYAEDPARDFRPSAGMVTHLELPESVRFDSWIDAGVEVPAYYDPMLAKLIVKGATRDEAVEHLSAALHQTAIAGIQSNLDYLKQVVVDDQFMTGKTYTRYLNSFVYEPHTIEVLNAGTQTMVQDYPGRLGYWDVGVPPSGPIDNYAFRLGNRLLGNDEDAAGLEMTISGPSLKFNADSMIALTGARMKATLNGESVPFWQAVAMKNGDVLKLGAVQGSGQRSYLCVAHGLQLPDYLGSKSTFTLGGFGGHCGRALRVGDALAIKPAVPTGEEPKLPSALIPQDDEHLQIRVLYGPHGAPDFFTGDDIGMFFDTDWEVHYNSNRTGIRLIGPKPAWARSDGGEAGLHPSNIHDNAYAVGTIDFTGDMPIILGPDGPSLGGFVCPATIIKADLWKMGQLKPGDRVRFVLVDESTAVALEKAQLSRIEHLQALADEWQPLSEPGSPILRRVEAEGDRVAVTYRQAGDDNILVEFGEARLDLELRFRAHTLMQWIGQRQVAGIIDLTPGIRSLQIHFDNIRLPREELLALLIEAEAEQGDVDELEVSSRIVHLPLSWDDEQTRLAIDKYMQSVRKDAPWCPSNIEFIRRINGLESIDEVKRIVFEASYLVLGLGDVYLGAPVATPVDPRHRLVTTKYNPARTWTPENAVGIGGSYMCVYGMEGPGGYQFVGRTTQVWNSYRQTEEFIDDKPWLLRFFDQIRFYPVSHEELMRMREELPLGRCHLKIEPATFSLKEYRAFLQENEAGIAEFKARQQQAFDEERARWEASGQANYDSVVVEDEQPAEQLILNEGEEAAVSPVHGNIWKVLAEEGQQVAEGDALVIVESMKMEVPVVAPCSGKVSRVLCSSGLVSAGQSLVVIEEEVA